MSKKNMLIIAGPTGVGKTDLALSIGDSIPSEILNIDIGQFYTDLSIGTAKPNWKSEKVPHHLFDIINEPINITVHKYREIVLEKMEEVWQKNKLPILVGGSGFYIKSLLFPTISKTENIFQESTQDNSNLWQQLYEIDPKRAEKIHKNDSYRINRALSIWRESGKLPSEYLPDYNPPSNYVLLFLTREREQLYKRIDERVIQMLDQGWLEEVKNLKSEWLEFLKVKKIIGYDVIIEFLENSISYEQMVSKIQQKVRNYAKRQITFFKMLTRNIVCSKDEKYKYKIVWLNLTLLDPDLYIRDLINVISDV